MNRQQRRAAARRRHPTGRGVVEAEAGSTMSKRDLGRLLGMDRAEYETYEHEDLAALVIISNANCSSNPPCRGDLVVHATGLFHCTDGCEGSVHRFHTSVVSCEGAELTDLRARLVGVDPYPMCDRCSSKR